MPKRNLLVYAPYKLTTTGVKKLGNIVFWLQINQPILIKYYNVSFCNHNQNRSANETVLMDINDHIKSTEPFQNFWLTNWVLILTLN